MFDRMVPAALVLFALTTACSKSEPPKEENKNDKEKTGAPAKCKSDSDCKGGTLCESGACVPEEVAKKVRAKDKPVASAAPAASAEPEKENPIPEIPTEKSKPPKTDEWNDGKEVNTQESNSQPDKCTMRVLREWLQVNCRQDYSSYEQMENFGLKNTDYFEYINPGSIVSFVVRLQKGKTQRVHICGEGKRANLFVNWPAQKDRPVHIALGKGGRCDTEKEEKEKEEKK